MLDAYIIDRIRNERSQKRESERPTLHIEIPADRPRSKPAEEQEEGPDRGSTVIDYRL